MLSKMKKIFPIFNLKASTKKKVLIVVISIFGVIGILSVANTLTGDRLNNFFALSVLYFKNSEEVKFDKMILTVPFDFIRRKDQDSLVLLKFPLGGGVIIIDRKNNLPKEKFMGEFKDNLPKMHLTPINEAEILVGGEKAYLITAFKGSNSQDYREYITIPNKQIFISFIGDNKSAEDFSNIVKRIKFASD